MSTQADPVPKQGSKAPAASCLYVPPPVEGYAAALARGRDLVRDAPSAVVLTGAGISAESGVPTFRGPDGLWRSFRPEDLATPAAFANDPLLVWQWYDWRRERIVVAKPNAGHRALVELEQALGPRCFTLVTQNVDGLHRLAGSAAVIHLHGDIWFVRCTVCEERHEERSVPLRPLPPRCACGGLLRPDVVWFNEPLPAGALEQAMAAVRATDLVLVIGTSSLVYPAAALPKIALEAHIPVVVVNLEPTPLWHSATVALQGAAAELLPQLVEGKVHRAVKAAQER